jgi:hypothetical protein
LKAVSAGCLMGSARAADQSAEERAIEAVKGEGEKAGLSGFEVSRSPHYLGIGNAPAAFRADALRLCEGLADDYLEHFQKRGFEVRAPEDRLNVVILDGEEDFRKFTSVHKLPDAVSGIYDLGTNYLVMFDNRDGENLMAPRANTFVLVHEATHQLTFNTGLLDRLGDVPALVSEGLGCYGETRRPSGQVKMGAVNRERLLVLADVASKGGRLTPVRDLLTDDDRFRKAETALTAYSEAWLFIHLLMSSKKAAEAFRGYLDAIRPRKAAEHRKEDFEAKLGKPDVLDAAMKRHANRLLG